MKTVIACAAVLCALLSQGAYAIDRVDGSGLSAEQTAKAQIFIESMKKETPSAAEGISAATRREVSAWTDLGANIGKSMVAAAKELGTAASDFAQTDLGKIITVCEGLEAVARRNAEKVGRAPVAKSAGLGYNGYTGAKTARLGKPGQPGSQKFNH